MTDLLTRLEKLEGPCRECDVRIRCLELNFEFVRMSPRKKESVAWGDKVLSTACDAIVRVKPPRGPGCEEVMIEQPKPYTASLDAIVGLIERDLPTHRIMQMNETSCRTEWRVRLQPPCSNWPMAGHANPAIALCIAYVKAKEATRNAKEER